MSDNFFFKGRQVPRLDHTKDGHKNKAIKKNGSKKYPLTLVVTSEERKQEIQTQVDEAKLFANISLDNNDGAVESIAELASILDKGATVKLDKTPSRNEPCSCGSGKKYKKCCG